MAEYHEKIGNLGNNLRKSLDPVESEAQGIMDPGDLLGWQQSSRINAANNALKKSQNYAQSMSNANRDLYNQFYNKASDTYGDTAAKVDDYLKALEGMKTYDPGTFEYTGDVNDFYSKAADLRIKNAMNALRESSDIFSSDYQDAMAAKQQAMASEEWDKAYDRYMRDRSPAGIPALKIEAEGLAREQVQRGAQTVVFHVMLDKLHVRTLLIDDVLFLVSILDLGSSPFQP